MNAIVIASIVVTGTLLLGALLAVIFRGFGNMVDSESEALKAKTANIQPSVTFGHEIPVDADIEVQRREARKEAAKRAARLPRGANLGIGKMKAGDLSTSFDGLAEDPISAVRMAQFHGWAGLKAGTKAPVTAVKTQDKKGPSEAVPPVTSGDDLVPGKDYPVIEISEEMSPAEKRKALIANAKAKSAAVKKAKETATAQAVPTAEVASTPVAGKVEGTREAGTAATPVAGVDYEVIEITDDMSADDVRKARIANAKAKSAAAKRLRETGAAVVSTPVEVHEAAPPEAVAEEPSPAASEMKATDIRAEIPAPNYIDITDDMDADATRKARIHNAKEKSAYNKALRAAGIDPTTVA